MVHAPSLGILCSDHISTTAAASAFRFVIGRTMPLYVNCPACGHRLAVPEEYLGKQVRCPSCKHVFKAYPSEDRALSLEPAAQPIDPARPKNMEPFASEPAEPLAELRDDDWE